jgi:hypothetical protein
MNEHHPSAVSRRSLLKRGLCTLTGVAITSLTGTKTFAADTKIAKATVQYEDVAKNKGADCDDCIQFIPGKTATAPGTCKIVEGAINPHGHCLAFSPKPKK